MSQDWKRALLGLGVGCFLTVWILWPTLQSLTQVWRSNQAYQFAWLVVPLIAYMLGWHDRPCTLLIRPQPDLSGVALASIAAVAWIASDLMNIDAGRQLSFILAIQGVCMAALGWRAYWRLSPTLLLMFFMVPSGDFLQPILRQLTVNIIELFATAVDLPHQVEGFQIAIGESAYIVLNECAGLPYFLLATFLGYVFGLMLYRSIYKILALALFGAFIGILSNALRVWAIVWIDWVQGSQMPLTAHGNIQWVALLICLGLLFFVIGKLDEEKDTKNKDIAMFTSDCHSRQWAPVLAGFSVFIISGGAGWMLSNTQSTQNALPLMSAPRSILGWELTNPLATWLNNPRNNTRSLLLNYRRGGETLHVRVVEPMTAEAKLQESEVAPGESNTWRENSIQIKTACGTTGCVQLLHTIWENGKTEERQHVYSTYALGSLYTASKFVLRAAHGWTRLTGGFGKPRLIALTFDSAVPLEGSNELAEILRSFQIEVVD